MPVWLFRRIGGKADLSSKFFLHQPDEIAVRVANESCPELVVRHLGRQLWSALVCCSASHDRRMRGVNVGDLEVKDRVKAGSSGTPQRAQHNAHAAGRQESETRRCTKEKLQPEDIAIEGQRRADVADRNGNLPNFGEFVFNVHCIVAEGHPGFKVADFMAEDAEVLEIEREQAPDAEAPLLTRVANPSRRPDQHHLLLVMSHHQHAFQ